MIVSITLGNIIIALVTGLYSSPPQEASKGTNWAINPKDSPVELAVYNRGHFVTNKTEKEIAEFRFACVEVHNRGWKVIYEIPQHEVRLQVIFGHGPSLPVNECVEKRKARVVVSRVKYVDGTEWRVPRIFTEAKGPEQKKPENPTLCCARTLSSLQV